MQARATGWACAATRRVSACPPPCCPTAGARCWRGCCAICRCPLAPPTAQHGAQLAAMKAAHMVCLRGWRLKWGSELRIKLPLQLMMLASITLCGFPDGARSACLISTVLACA